MTYSFFIITSLRIKSRFSNFKNYKEKKGKRSKQFNNKENKLNINCIALNFSITIG